MFRHEFLNTWQGLANLLIKMHHTGSVEDYKTQFTKLSRSVTGFSADLLLACFIGGLKDDIRMDVKAQRPRTRLSMMHVSWLKFMKRNMKLGGPSSGTSTEQEVGLVAALMFLELTLQ